MATGSKKTGKQVQESAEKIEALVATVAALSEGDTEATIDVGLTDPLMKKLANAIKDLAATAKEHQTALEARTEELHSASMEVALGLSDCFRALSEVRGGNLAARVDDATLSTDDELLSKFGHDLNLTLADFQDIVERQQYAIQTLSTPILQIWDDVLVLPVIGVVDSARAAELMDKLLNEIVIQQAKYVILDITGVDVIDTRTADHFLKLISSAQLLGTQCVVTGIQPAVAQTLVELRVELGTITTMRNLQAGLRECLRRLSGRQTRPAKNTTGA